MRPVDFFREKIRDFASKDIVYYLFPAILIAILYYSFLPFSQTYIGEWHDIFANSLYYSLVDHNYLVAWNNLWAGGFPITANPHSDKYYLFSFPFYLVFQNLTIVNVIILLHLLIAYFAFFKLGSLITENRNTLLIFSVFYAFSGIMLGRIYGGHHLLLYGLAWLPLIYFFFLKMVLYKEVNAWNAVGLTLVSVLVYLTGNLYHFVLVYLILLVLFLWYAATGKVDRNTVCYLVLSVVLTTLLLSVKLIPDIGVTSAVIRQDVIDPLAGGGSVETALSSFFYGIRIDSLWAQYESGVMIGIIPVLLLVIALIYGKKEIAIPGYFAILFSLIWAGAGKSIFAFLHLLPIVSNFRNPGRIYGALLPLLLFLALYGVVVLHERMKQGGGFALTDEQKKLVMWGTGVLVLVKLLELPYQEMIGAETLVSLIVVMAFIALLWSGRGSEKNLLLFFLAALGVNAAVILAILPVAQSPLLIPLLITGLLLAGFYLFVQKCSPGSGKSRLLCGILLAGIFIMMMGNIGSGYISANSPGLEESPAPMIIQQVRDRIPGDTPLVAYETGVPIWHMDFTYWDVVNGIHALSVYSATYLKTMPQLTYTLGNVTYFTPNYIVDTQYRENGIVNIPNVTFVVQNISVYIPEHVLPTVFALRGEEMIPLTLVKYSPGEVIASGNLQRGDVVVLKENYYKGWKVNGADAIAAGTMVGIQLDNDISTVRFVFDPLDYKIGVVLSVLGLIIAICLLFKRRDVDRIISRIFPPGASMASAKDKKKKRK
jgi:hypothetical protein